MIGPVVMKSATLAGTHRIRGAESGEGSRHKKLIEGASIEGKDGDLRT
jgi:hypothetical protein